MRAAVVTRYGPPEVVAISEVATPVPGDTEILIRVMASTVNSGDVRVRALRVPRGTGLVSRFALGFFKPRQPILGFEVAGEVAAVGSRVTKFRPGDRVVASRGFGFGGHADFLTISEDGAIALIPDEMGFADAVAVLFGGITARSFFKAAGLKSGESLLINGASGAVGTMAIQYAKHLGAEVTAVCSGANADLVRALGADHVIDYTRQDITALPEAYDVIMDAHGNLPYAKVKHLLKPGGRFLLVVGDLPQMLQARRNPAMIAGGDEKDAFSAASFAELMGLAAAGVLKPVIDRTYPFDQIVAAHRHVDSGRKRGSVVVTLV